MTRKEKQQAITEINGLLEDNNSPYRLCCECGKPLQEGWYYASSEMCCCDQCAAKHEGVSLKQFKADRENVPDEDFENWEEGYFTTVPA